MSDDWEEDFEVPDLLSSNTSAPAKKFEDEEEEESPKPPSKPSGSSKPVVNEAAAKKAKEEELKLANKLKFTQLDNLSPEQRRLREREMIEESDKRIASELFGEADSGAGNEEDVARGLGSIPIKTKQDHINFATLCAGKLEESTPFNVLAFYKEITEEIKSKLTLEGLDDIIKSLTAVRDEKKKTATLQSKTKKSAKQIKEEKKRHDDVYGGVDDYGGDSRYDALEDDFM